MFGRIMKCTVRISRGPTQIVGVGIYDLLLQIICLPDVLSIRFTTNWRTSCLTEKVRKMKRLCLHMVTLLDNWKQRKFAVQCLLSVHTHLTHTNTHMHTHTTNVIYTVHYILCIFSLLLVKILFLLKLGLKDSCIFVSNFWNNSLTC